MRELNKKYWPAKVAIDYNDSTHSETIKWCKLHIGRDQFRIVGSSTFYFANNKDATFFTLRWQ